MRLEIMDAYGHYKEFRRLFKSRVEVFEVADPEYLEAHWYYPLYKSFSTFIEQYPEHSDRVELLESSQDNAVAVARGFEMAELDVAELFGRRVFR
jgi:hypothetical protein